MLPLEHNKAIIKVLDELNVVVSGLHRKDVEHFYNSLGFYDKGYRFKPAYKMGRWDGKLRFFDKNGKTSINMLPLIVPDLVSRGYKMELIDNRSTANITVPLIDETYMEHVIIDDQPIILGEHQVEGINAVTKNGGRNFIGSYWRW